MQNSASKKSTEEKMKNRGHGDPITYNAEADRLGHIPSIDRTSLFTVGLGRTPNKSRLNLGSASSYYFKNLPKTPMEKEISERKKLNSSVSHDAAAVNDSFNGALAMYDGSTNAIETSFLSLASSSSSESADMLNKSVLSDTTELTASNFVLLATSRQRFAELKSIPMPPPKPTERPNGTENVPPYMPLTSLVKDSIQEQRRNSLPLSTVAQPKQIVNQGVIDPRRESWQGIPSNALASPDIVANLRNFAEMARKARLTRYKQREAESAARFSMDGDTSVFSLPREENGLAAASFSSDVERPPITWGVISQAPATDPGTIDSTGELDVSKRSLDELFDGLFASNDDTTNEQETSNNLSMVNINDSMNCKKQTLLDKLSESPRLSQTTTTTNPNAPSTNMVTLTTFPQPPTEMDDGSIVMGSVPIDQLIEPTSVSSVRMEDQIVLEITEHEVSVPSNTQHEQNIPIESTRHSPPSVKSTVTVRNADIAMNDSTPSEVSSSGTTQTQSASTLTLFQSQSVQPSTMVTTVGSLGHSQATVTFQRSSFPPSVDSDSVEHTDMESSSLRATTASPFSLSPRSDRKLTPTKLTGSPRRIPNPMAVDSPARNTRSASKRRSFLPDDAHSLSMGVEHDNSAQQPSYSPARSTVSPASTITTASGITAQSPTMHSSLAHSPLTRPSEIAFTRNRTQDSISIIARGPSKTTPTKLPASPERFLTNSLSRNAAKRQYDSGGRHDTLSSRRKSSFLNSSFRKDENSSKAFSLRKSVAFGSPEVVEFNASSPSMSVTPMPGKKLKSMTDDTTEIEADMNALLRSSAAMLVVQPFHIAGAGFTPGKGDKLSGVDEMKAPQQDEGSGTETSFSSANNESVHETDFTVELERGMAELVAPSLGYVNDIETTKESATDAMSLDDDTDDKPGARGSFVQAVGNEIGANFSPTDNESAHETELTVELESGMAELVALPLGYFRDVVATEAVGDPMSFDDDETPAKGTKSSEIEASGASLQAEETEIGAKVLPTNHSSVHEAELTVELENGLGELVARPLGYLGDIVVAAESAGDSMSIDDDDHDKDTTNPWGEDKTTTLEVDMASLIRGAKVADIDDKDGTESPSPVVHRRQRRSSMSSRRFSLAPQCRSPSSCEDVSFDSAQQPDETQLSLDDAPAMYLQELTLQPMDLLSEEPIFVFESTGDSDVMAEAYLILGRVVDSHLITEIFLAVQSQVEKSMQPDIDLLVSIQPATENLHCLQKSLNGNESHHVRSEIASLLECVRRSEYLQFLDWLVTVAGTLRENLQRQNVEADDDADQLELAMNRLDERLRDVTVERSSSSRRAKKKSFDRQTLMIAELQEQCAGREIQLQNAFDRLTLLQTDLHGLESLTALMVDNRSLSLGVATISPAVASKESNYRIMKGLNKLRPVKLEMDQLVFHLVGSTPGSCLVVTIDLLLSGSMTCVARVEPSIFQQYKCPKLSRLKPLSLFMAKKASELCVRISQTYPSGAQHVGTLLRNIVWQMNRMEVTASELAMLYRRYKAWLTQSEIIETAFELEVDFTSLDQQTCVVASFQLTDAYPFAPLDVSLHAIEGCEDLDAIRKLMLKNAKPGFGYLSRTCDIISAFQYKKQG